MPVLFALLLLLAGCVTPAERAERRPAAPGEPIVFFDSDIFDNELANGLSATPEKLAVKPAAPMTVNSVPPRLNAWMAAVQARGGRVQMVGRDPAAPQQQQFVSLLLPIASAALSALLPDKQDILRFIKESRTYGQADGYDIRVFYVPGSGRIDDFVFERRP